MASCQVWMCSISLPALYITNSLLSATFFPRIYACTLLLIFFLSLIIYIYIHPLSVSLCQFHFSCFVSYIISQPLLDPFLVVQSSCWFLSRSVFMFSHSQDAWSCWILTSSLLIHIYIYFIYHDDYFYLFVLDFFSLLVYEECGYFISEQCAPPCC